MLDNSSRSELTDAKTLPTAADGVPLTRQSAERTPQVHDSGPLTLRMDYTQVDTPVLSVEGDLDADTCPRLAKLLWPRLMSKMTALIVDLRPVRFLGVAGLELLASAHAYAEHRGVSLHLVRDSHAVDRALATSGLDAVLPCSATVIAARSTLLSSSTPERETGGPTA